MPEFRFQRQPELIGTSAAMQELYGLIRLFAPVDLTVLIEGESGTGKELVAKAIHRLSSRSSGIFVPINCAELTDTMAQSELFGHEKGAFTGADRLHIGWFERASGGTLFLDEIGDLAKPLQGKLLRALQEGQIHRLGGTRWIDVNVRIIAATNVDLEGAIARKQFREDLYHRINVLSLKTPALRERTEDIMLLAEHFMRRFEQESGIRVAGISPEAVAILQNYPWPGNVRELQNASHRIAMTAANQIVQPEHLPPGLFKVSLVPVSEASLECADLLKQIEREVHRIVLDHFAGNAQKAAQFVGRKYKNFLRTLRRLGLDNLSGPDPA